MKALQPFAWVTSVVERVLLTTKITKSTKGSDDQNFEFRAFRGENLFHSKPVRTKILGVRN
jgi:hypothetical protein